MARMKLTEWNRCVKYLGDKAQELEERGITVKVNYEKPCGNVPIHDVNMFVFDCAGNLWSTYHVVNLEYTHTPDEFRSRVDRVYDEIIKDA